MDQNITCILVYLEIVVLMNLHSRVFYIYVQLYSLILAWVLTKFVNNSIWYI